MGDGRGWPMKVRLLSILAALLIAPFVLSDGGAISRLVVAALGQSSGQTGGQGGQTGGGQTTGGQTTGGQTTGGQTTGGQTTGTATTGQTTGTTPPPTQGETAKPEDTQRKTGVETPPVKAPFYGYDFFANPRAAIEAQRTAMAANPQNAQINALTIGIGPDVLVPQPDRYQLGAGDRLKMRYWSPNQSPADADLLVDPLGTIVVPVTGKQVSVRGQTLGDALALLRRELRQGLRDADLTLELKELRSFQVVVLGESFAPGSYQMPAVATLFNAVYFTGGPTDRGSLRKIELRRSSGQTLTFDFYRYLAGDASKDVPLQPGDVIYYPPVGPRVTMSGEVNRPAVYELLPGAKLSDAMAAALGAKPSGVTQRVSIESLDPGQARKLIDVDITKNEPSQNPPLYDGDLVQILSIRPEPINAVALEGAVDQPGRYEITAGMTVRDLIVRARGLLPDAFVGRADLFRLNQDGSFSLISIKLADALAGMPNDNLALMPFDRLRIYTIAETAFIGTRQVRISGQVQRPAQFYRADNMRVGDLLLQAGGLLPDAAEIGFLQRYNPDGTTGPLIRLELKAIAAGNRDFDPVLQDRDEVRIYSIQETEFQGDQRVTIEGAVQRPTDYPRFMNMTVRDLLALAGNPLPDAYTEQAFLQRINLDKTVGPLLKIDLRKALAGDPEHNLELQDLDTLTVYTKQQAVFQSPQVVTISGAVQRPSTFPRAENMRVKDVILRAGGPLPNASDIVEISSINVPDGTPPVKVSLKEVLAEVPSANVAIKDSDTITIPIDAEILDKPIIVQLRGAVKYPGPYPLNSKYERLSDLIRRAGGLLEDSFLPGGQFLRNPSYLQTDSQQQLTPRVQEVLKVITDEEYRRELAKSDVDKIRESKAATEGAFPGVSLTGQGAQQPPPSVITPENPLFKRDTVSPARPLKEDEVRPGSNVNVDFVRALQDRGSRNDVILKDGDIVTIPERPTTVSVVGAVVVPAAVLFEPGKNLDHYLNLSGGITSDADRGNILVIRATGSVIRPNRSTRLEIGDTVFVPTKVMAIRLRDRQSELEGTIRNVANASIILAVIRSLAK